ncbi:MAG: hypothetical protein ACRC6I_22325, partial [Paracoccaceae bacterium]
MTIVALQAPWPAAVPRSERPAQTGIETQPATAVTQLPPDTTDGLIPHRNPLLSRTTENLGRGPAQTHASDAEEAKTPDPFPAMRFPDPLPDLPELDLP